jgi:hypothetical protein
MCSFIIPMFEFTMWHASFTDFFTKLRRYTAIGKQLLISNDKNRVRWAVLGLSQNEDWTDLFENFSENSWKRDFSNNITVTPLLFSSLVNTFKLFCKYLVDIWQWALTKSFLGIQKCIIDAVHSLHCQSFLDPNILGTVSFPLILCHALSKALHCHFVHCNPAWILTLE